MTACNFYPKFEANQVLTADQLNQLIFYLDKQEKITRSKLIGVGILCGFDLELVQSPSVAIKISKGCGITTEGYLIALNKFKAEKKISKWHTFTKYRTYKDPSKYSLFGDGDSQISLWELLYDDFEDENSVIEKLSLKFLEDKAVILFLEKKEVDLATCTGDDCNEKGIRVELCVRVLLISLSDLETIISKCGVSSVSKNYKNELIGKFKLPELSVEREHELNGSNSFYDYGDFKKLYGKIIEKSLKELPEVLTATYKLFNPLLKDMYEENPFDKFSIEETLVNFLKANPFGWQYCYDLFKDIALTYNEFRETIFDLSAACCYDEECFPRHLMLGEAVPTNKCTPSVYRNQFISSPVYNNQKHLYEKTRLIFKRLVRMIETFALPEEKENKIRITPGKGTTELGLRAMPYYYFAKEFGINNVWNYELTRRCKPFYNLSYYSKNYPEGSAPVHIINPLNYNIHEYDFFRVEGYLGMKCGEVMEILLGDIKKYNLPIKILRLKLGKEPAEKEKLPDCRFQDLEMLYKTIRTEYLCFLENELKYFGQLDYGYSEKEETKYGGLKVTVVDKKSGGVIASAKINLEPASGKTSVVTGMTNKSGIYLFQKIPVGNYTLTVTRTGYHAEIQEVVIEEAKSKIIIISLKEKNTETGGFWGMGEGFIEEITEKAKGEILSAIEGIVYSEKSVGNIYLDYLASANKDFMGYFETRWSGKAGAESAGEFINKYYYPLQIVDILDDLPLFVPVNMNNFNFADLSEKTDSLTEVVTSFTEQINKNLDDEKYEQTGTESEILIHLNELIKTCTLKNFKELVATYKKRAAEIYKLTLFNEFVKKHSGIEHKAGVEKGGTFILVCDENNIAVADFCLPYICCSDCPPITYVLADQPVIFKLSKTTYCANDSSNYVIINEPTGGIVSGPGVTQDSATGQYYFNPSQAGVGQIKLTYTFNLQTYNLLVNVIEIKPNFTYTLGKPQPDSGTRDVSFAALPDSADSYEWDFGDGVGKSTEQKPTYTYNVSELQTFEVKLTVKKGECSGSVTQKIIVPTCSAEFTYKIEKVLDYVAVVQFDSLMKEGDKYEWDFGDGSTYSGEDPLHKYIVSEINSFKVVLKVGKGDCQDTNEKEITINVCTAEFSHEIIKTSTNKAEVLFTAKTTDAEKYVWDFGDGTTSGSVNSPQITHSYLLKESEQKISVKLVMQKEICTVSETVTIVLPPVQQITISLDKNEFCKKDETAYKFKLSTTGGEVIGKGVTKKDNDFYFSPSSDEVKAGTVTFTYKLPDGNSSEYSVKVYNPVVKFEIRNITRPNPQTQPTAFLVEIENLSQNAERFIWSLNGVIFSKDQTPKLFIPEAAPGAQFELSLTASFNICSDTTKTILTIPTVTTDVIDNVSVITGGGTTVFTPTETGVVLTNQPTIAFDTNLTTINNLTENPLFGNVLTSNVAAYKNTKTYFNAIKEELVNTTTRRLYINGSKNDEIAEKFGTLFDQIVTRITTFAGADSDEQRRFAYNLVLLQASQLFNLMGLQKDDITAESSIAGLFAAFNKQLSTLKESGIELNPDGKFKEMISSAATVSENKPLLLTYLERLSKAAVE